MNQVREVVGNSRAIKSVLKMVDRVAKTDIDCLILGETGTGKEVISRYIHAFSARKNGPFVAVNCSALSESLLESELFGHVKGAFTGAIKDKIGRFELANGGTLLLDEIGELSPNLQVKLLRVLQERQIERVGEAQLRDIDVRIIAATNKNLKKLIEEEKFREDLFYRLNVFPIELPTLKNRKDDILLLFDYFLHKYSGRRFLIASETEEILNNYSWPGNIRELENVARHVLVLVDGNTIEKSHLPNMIKEQPSFCNTSRNQTPQEICKALQKALTEAHGNRSEAARILGVSRVTIWKWMKKYQITESDQQGNVVSFGNLLTEQGNKLCAQ